MCHFTTPVLKFTAASLSIMSNRQATLFSSWQTSQCKRARIEPEESNRSSPEFEDAGSDDDVSPSVLQGSTSEQSSQQRSAQCCSTADEAFQPTDKPTLSGLSSKQRNFQSKWYKDYPWLSVCATYKKVFCLYCRYGSNHGLLSFANFGEKAFTKSGFNNWKKALEKFRAHEISHSQRSKTKVDGSRNAYNCEPTKLPYSKSSKNPKGWSYNAVEMHQIPYSSRVSYKG